MYFVYKFIDSKDEVIYVGKTKVGIRNRINQHFSNSGHLSKECYRQVQRIEYQTIPNKLEMDIKELYYIGKWKPKYNTINNYKEEEFTLKIVEENDWEHLKFENPFYAPTPVRTWYKSMEELEKAIEKDLEHFVL